jgi:nucleotide-binding universal stress UspA family protein
MAASGVWRAILDVADQHDVAVIVAGSRGLSGITSLVLGSVSHGLANHAHRPLLIVPVAQD